jgi:hypothetical protein
MLGSIVFGSLEPSTIVLTCRCFLVTEDNLVGVLYYEEVRVVVLPGVVAAGTKERRCAVLAGVVLGRIGHRDNGAQWLRLK